MVATKVAQQHHLQAQHAAAQKQKHNAPHKRGVVPLSCGGMAEA